MTLWAIVPVKPLRRGKSRLSTVLSETERTLLNHNLLVSTLKILSSVNRIDQILVVSRDPAALTLAREYDARTVLENGSPELNTALSRAALVAKTYRVNEILILPADLPLLTTKELERVLRLSGNPPEILICPDRRKDGTNLLYINPEGLISFSYGSGSFNKHLELARQSGARVNIISSNSLELDLDTPEDLELMKSIQDQQKQQIDH
ncbi:MAG TPA: 2-phospho-L-lactate guanylyltransferase [Anaerolineaceae bacterium]|jgi:2-phospho-L-lactate guanylyltransferase|nr:2-phospho-L-lactate guanylyltransferase [Anaerolineaceae bacterium]HNW14734.1 2-phospho-L-lactate guanylyltransferase [Anaerolineaceae bacterium]HOE02445.1 2-phospho-L-lactate guanylyltransferase [Anaerolineaceae bacterium]HQM54385.1 2-phospho-L-lactate guanylyltransferase [Anaerolineaceae bacterium]